MAVAAAPFAHMASTFAGRLVFPESDGYNDERLLWNAMFDRRPSVIAKCADTADVVAAVRFARENNLPFTVRSGGHEATGCSLADGVMAIDLGLMHDTVVDPVARRATVQAGARMLHMDRATQAHGLGLTGGTVSDTGVGGLTLGGGIGWTMRRLGLTIDSLAGVEAVTVDGEVVRASANENSDLFWAMRGGGGNFAIATAFNFHVHRLGPIVLAGQVVHSHEHARAALRVWRDFMQTAPDDIGSMAVISRGRGDHIPREARGQIVVYFMIAWIGDLDAGGSALAPFREWGVPLADTIAPMAYVDLQRMLEGDFGQRSRAYEKGGHMSALDDDFVDEVLDAIETAPVAGPGEDDVAVLSISALGGQIDRVADDATAFPRDGLAYFWAGASMWSKPAEDERWIDWLRGVAKRVERFSNLTTYLNLTSDEDDDRIRQAYGAKFDRLVEVKNRWDPENVLRYNKNIRPSRGAVRAGA